MLELLQLNLLILLLRLLVNMVMSSMDYFFLDECVLVHLGDVLSRIDLVMACLGEWHDQATAEAATR